MKKYLNSAVLEFTKTKTLTVAGLMLALHVIISIYFIKVPIAGNDIRIYFSFIAFAIGGMIYGPFVAPFVGIAADLIGYTLHGVGAFFPGYTLSAALGALIFALFFYRSRITVLKILLAKLTINLFVNAFLGTLWINMMAGKGYLINFSARLIKNLLMLPIEVLVIFILLQVLIPVLVRMGFKLQKERIKLF